MNPEILNIGVETGKGAVLGGFVGFASKKVLKLAAVLAGFAIGVLAALEAYGFLEVDWVAVERFLVQLRVELLQLHREFVYELRVLPLGSGFLLGFFLGFKKG
jgi:uncharacterized membrane protein (Fun14 family)